MSKSRHHTGSIVLAALLVGLSLSGGPVVWAVIIMLSPLALFVMLERSVHSGTHAAYIDRRYERVG